MGLEIYFFFTFKTHFSKTVNKFPYFYELVLTKPDSFRENKNVTIFLALLSGKGVLKSLYASL